MSKASQGRVARRQSKAADAAVMTQHANRFTLAMGERVRIAFGERGADGEDYYHQAVSLSRADAVELAAMLANLVLGPDAPKADGAPAEAAAPNE